ncbi:MAG TPA: hypothetical protein VM367_08165, partial [Pseudonocardia sp.]|nr:hypothetical protein [Pseudonocardia sp.]
MTEVSLVEPVPESAHELLLALAGHVDDDLLAWARELVAVGEDGQALDAVTAAVIADRVALPGGVRSALVSAARWSRAELDADRTLPPAVEAAAAHRFEAGEPTRIDAVVDALPTERLAGCRIRLAWRLTPAGSAPGPLPHPVLLVEPSATAVPELLTHVVRTALDRAGFTASVEVLPPGYATPGYHRVALAVARELASPPVSAGLAEAGSEAAGIVRAGGRRRAEDRERAADR